jgi:hypothetical protein
VELLRECWAAVAPSTKGIEFRLLKLAEDAVLPPPSRTS